MKPATRGEETRGGGRLLHAGPVTVADLKKNNGLRGKFLQPPAELPLTHRPSLTDTVQLCLSSQPRASGVKLHISSLVKFLVKSANDILEGNVKEEVPCSCILAKGGRCSFLVFNTSGAKKK